MHDDINLYHYEMSKRWIKKPEKSDGTVRNCTRKWWDHKMPLCLFCALAFLEEDQVVTMRTVSILTFPSRRVAFAHTVCFKESPYYMSDPHNASHVTHHSISEALREEEKMQASVYAEEVKSHISAGYDYTPEEEDEMKSADNCIACERDLIDGDQVIKYSRDGNVRIHVGCITENLLNQMVLNWCEVVGAKQTKQFPPLRIV
jgi:hypothetical protein